MKLAALLIALGGALLVAALTRHVAGARTTYACGKVSGVLLHAHDVRCRTARRVYRSDRSENLARGWTCSASLARCIRLVVWQIGEMVMRSTSPLRGLRLLPALAAALLLGAPATGAAHGYYASCGSPFGGTSIIQHGTSCSQARAVMQKVYVKSQEVAPVGGVLHAHGWSCTLNPAERQAITCRRGSGVIKGPTPG